MKSFIKKNMKERMDKKQKIKQILSDMNIALELNKLNMLAMLSSDLHMKIQNLLRDEQKTKKD